MLKKKAVKNKNTLLKSSAVVSFLTLVSRLLGMVREIMIAYFFGASVGTDAFFIANRIPNFLRRIFAEGAFTQAFIPILTQFRLEKSTQEVKDLLRNTIGLLILALTVLIFIVELIPSLIITLFAPGFTLDPNKLAIAADMLRLTFPYIIFISLVTVAAGVFNSYGRFAVAAITPVILNISFIVAIVFLAPILDKGYMALAWAVAVAGVIQLAWQIPFLAKLNLLVMPKLNWRHAGVRKVIKLMLPAIAGASVVQVNLLIDNVLASFLVVGSISWLSYSVHLMELPVALFGIAIATVVLPYLSYQQVNFQQDKIDKVIDWSLKMVLILGIPSCIALVVLAQPIVITLFYYGSLEWVDVVMSAKSLQAYALGLVFFMLIKTIVPIFFAHQDTKTPVKIALIAVGVNLSCNLILIGWWQHVGLAVATSIAAIVQALILLYYMYKRSWYTPQAGWKFFILKIILANIILLAFLLGIRFMPISLWLDSPFYWRIIYLATICCAGLLIYFSSLYLCGIKIHKLESSFRM